MRKRRFPSACLAMECWLFTCSWSVCLQLGHFDKHCTYVSIDWSTHQNETIKFHSLIKIPLLEIFVYIDTLLRQLLHQELQQARTSNYATVHKPTFQKFHRMHRIAKGIHDTIQPDLSDRNTDSISIFFFNGISSFCDSCGFLKFVAIHATVLLMFWACVPFEM